MAGMTVTYQHPAATSPTIAQMTRRNTVVANVVTGAAANEDDTDVIHSLNLTPADGSNGRPEITITCLANGTVLTALSAAFKDKDTITLTKIIKGANTGATYQVVIKRPHSLVR